MLSGVVLGQNIWDPGPSASLPSPPIPFPFKFSSHFPTPPLPCPPLRSKKGKGSPYSITERRVPELIPVLGSQPAGDVSHKPGGRLPLLSARPAVPPATLKRFATNLVSW